MSAVFAAGSLLSLLLDVLPPVLLAVLAVMFFRRRHQMKEEERALREAVKAFDEDSTENEEKSIDIV